MKRLFAIAAFLLASTAAQAQYTFEYGGRTIRIDPDRGTVSIPGVYDNTGRRSSARTAIRTRRPRKQAPEQAKVDPQAPAAAPRRPTRRRRRRPPAPAAAASPAPSTATANVGATVGYHQPRRQPAASRPRRRFSRTPPPPPQARAASGRRDGSAPAAPVPLRARAVQAANSPLGVWLTEEKEGKVRIEQCGANLCGYSVDAKSNQNGEQVLINMKPGKDSKWSGRILDPNTGSTYDSTIALKGTDTPARPGLRLRRHVLRRPDLEPRELTILLRISQAKGPASSAGLLLGAPCRPRSASRSNAFAPKSRTAFGVTPITFSGEPLCDDARVQQRGTSWDSFAKQSSPSASCCWSAMSIRHAGRGRDVRRRMERSDRLDRIRPARSGASVSIGINNGQVASNNAMVTASGQVADAGSISVTLVSGIKRAVGSGHLTAHVGIGHLARRAVLGHLDRAADLTSADAALACYPTLAAYSASVTCSIQVT